MSGLIWLPGEYSWMLLISPEKQSISTNQI